MKKKVKCGGCGQFFHKMGVAPHQKKCLRGAELLRIGTITDAEIQPTLLTVTGLKEIIKAEVNGNGHHPVNVLELPVALRDLMVEVDEAEWAWKNKRIVFAKALEQYAREIRASVDS